MIPRLLLLSAAGWIALEVWQLVQVERHLGARPRAGGPGERRAFLWTAALLAYWLWMVGILFVPAARLHALGLLLVTMAGFALRRGARRARILRLLTVEGAIRGSLLLSLGVSAWRRL